MMTRKEYLENEIIKYRGYILLFTIGHIISVIIYLLLTGYVIVFWWVHDDFSLMQVLKLSISKFWYLYIYIICLEFIRQFKMKTIVNIYKSFNKQLSEIQDGNDN